ncbi:MAG: PilZ domain-containing protein [Candidatus Methylomirabilales bacterium]
MTKPGDRRHSPRAFCDISVEYTCTGTRAQDGRIANIGTGGALLSIPEAIPVGTTLVLRFDLPPSNRPIQAVGEVKWLNQQKVGVGFVGLTVWEQQGVWQYYAKAAPR